MIIWIQQIHITPNHLMSVDLLKAINHGYSKKIQIQKRMYEIHGGEVNVKHKKDANMLYDLCYESTEVKCSPLKRGGAFNFHSLLS